jgi:sec-independent protein translocase protein TatC
MQNLPSSEEEKDRSEMHFLDHLEEFRWVIIRSLAAFLVACCVVGGFITFFAKLLARPLEIATERLGTDIGSLVTISPWGVFTVFLQIIFLGGLALSLPFILYFIAGFLAPGLTRQERRLLFPGCLLAMVLFLVGAAFAYFFIIPLSVYVSLQFNQYFGLQIVWTASHFYSFVVWMILAVGGSFEFPLILLLLQYAQIVKPEFLRKHRNIVLIIIMVLSAIITPSDPLSMLVLAIPLYLLYEASILMGAVLVRRRASKEDEADKTQAE